MTLEPAYEPLDEHGLATFLEGQGLRATVTRERTDLSYVDVRIGDGEAVRLRTAILPSAARATEELSQVLRARGEGAWGLRRGNLAVLAPSGTPERILGFATRTRLACWGVLMAEDGGDVVVVPGGYQEL